MKTINLILIGVLMICSSLHAQVIPNSDFEIWNSDTMYENPQGYNSTNTFSYATFQSSNVTKSSSAFTGNYSVRMETKANAQDTIFGGVFIGMPGDGGISGGLPYAARPDSVRLAVKFNIMPGDTATLTIFFKKNGSVMAMAHEKVAGVQATWVSVSRPISWMIPVVNPDTLVVILSSSGLDGGGKPGSILYVDDIQLIGSSVPQIPNNGFEQWSPVISEDPQDWYTFNFFAFLNNEVSVSKTSDKYSGNYAAQIKSVNLFGDTMGFLSLGDFGDNGPQGGIPVFQNPKRISGYYKYSPVGPDTALAAVFTYVYDSGLGVSYPVDTIIVKLLPTLAYTPFEVVLPYNSWPIIDTMNIMFASGNIANESGYIGLGSILKIDSLNIFYNPVSVEEKSSSEIKISIHPNPADNYVNIVSNTQLSGAIRFKIYDSYGRVVANKVINPETSSAIDVSSLPAGFYLWEIQTSDKIIRSGKLILL